MMMWLTVEETEFVIIFFGGEVGGAIVGGGGAGGEGFGGVGGW